MNEIYLKGIIKNIRTSHTIEDIAFDKAQLIVKRKDGKEDVIDLKFKSFSIGNYKENDFIEIKGNIRSFSLKTEENKNKVNIYVFTYFDKPENLEIANQATIDGRICKINKIRTTKNGKHNVHLIIANNIFSGDGKKRLNSYIPCIAWGKVAKRISKLDVNTKILLKGELHSREHRKRNENGEIEIRIAHEFLISDYEVLDQMLFNYMYTYTSENSIEIPDIGNFSMSISNQINEEWIMICKTEYGISTIIQAGPFNIDIDEMKDKVNYYYQRIEYNQNRLYKIIDSFINDAKKLISKVDLIETEEAKSRIKDIIKYI